MPNYQSHVDSSKKFSFALKLTVSMHFLKIVFLKKILFEIKKLKSICNLTFFDVNFEQRFSSAAHSKRWLKYVFSCFFHEKLKRNKKKVKYNVALTNSNTYLPTN